MVLHLIVEESAPVHQAYLFLYSKHSNCYTLCKVYKVSDFIHSSISLNISVSETCHEIQLFGKRQTRSGVLGNFRSDFCPCRFKIRESVVLI